MHISVWGEYCLGGYYARNAAPQVPKACFDSVNGCVLLGSKLPTRTPSSAVYSCLLASQFEGLDGLPVSSYSNWKIEMETYLKWSLPSGGPSPSPQVVPPLRWSLPLPSVGPSPSPQVVLLLCSSYQVVSDPQLILSCYLVIDILQSIQPSSQPWFPTNSYSKC